MHRAQSGPIWLKLLQLEKPMGILAWFLAGGLLTTITVGTIFVLASQRHTDVTTAHDSSHAVLSIVVGALSLRRSCSAVGGVVLNIVPRIFPIVALNDIAQLDLSNAAAVATIAAVYVTMFAFVEVPLVTYCFAPERTMAAVADFNAWLARSGRCLGVAALAAVGLCPMVHGIVQLVA